MSFPSLVNEVWNQEFIKKKKKMVNEFLISLLQTRQRAAFIIAKQLKTAD